MLLQRASGGAVAPRPSINSSSSSSPTAPAAAAAAAVAPPTTRGRRAPAGNSSTSNSSTTMRMASLLLRGGALARAARSGQAHPSCRPSASAAASAAPPAPADAKQQAPPSPSAAASGSAASSSSSSSSAADPSAPTFQQAIFALQDYWSRAAGCAAWLPHNTEVGAGTMNPATFLRVLGPEPWHVAYPEPSVRPDDSRYGENPNRVQRHTQFQVILKPDPGNAQELYLGSLKALGVDAARHDVRFVEDNWESPVLGAWGLGWEVWLDGMEVTQFTYFQQAGGRALEVPAVEITYGLERILMARQGVKHFKDIRYTDKLSYGELLLQNEVEMSRYNLDAADVGLARQRFALFGEEAKALLAARLPVPAYDMLLKMSHTFNVLDARGAVGVTERADCFASMRALAREVTSLWAERREELGHPLGVVAPPPAPVVPPPPPPSSSSADADANAAAAARDFVLEIGSEELPPADVESGIAQLRERLPALLAKLRLGHGGVSVEGTPRRLTARVAALAARQASFEAKVRGPPAKAAFADPAARAGPTKALEGFLKKNGATLEDVTVEAVAEGGGGKKGGAPQATDYVFAAVKDAGGSAAAALAAELPALVASLSFKKTMRWDAGGAAYPRPMRWLLALHGDDEVPFAHAGLVAGRRTRLLRSGGAGGAASGGGGGDGDGSTASPSDGSVSVARAEDYGAVLTQGRITLGVDERREAIWRDATKAAADATGGAGAIPLSARDGGDSVLDEVANLVESPTVVVGGFDPAFLELPPDVLVTVMRKHQRYFPVYAAGEQEEEGGGDHAANGASDAAAPDAGRPLLPKFVTVANGPVDVAAVAAGNEAVLRARFEDAAFFYREDLKTNLRDFRPRLKGTAFHRDLGSLFDKSVRVEALAAPLADALSLGSHAAHAAEAAALCKNDLATSVVTEMTELAGVMGRHYCQRQGVAAEVSEAVFEAALPRFAGDALPRSPAGLVVAVADRLDSLVGLVAAVGAPSATADPYGLRRAAYGMLQALIACGARLSLSAAVDLAAGVQPVDVPASKRAEVRDFVARRLEQLLVDGGAGPEAVRAVLAERGDDPALAAATAAQLAPLVSGAAASAAGPDRLKRVMTALARPTRIIRGKAAAEAAQSVDGALFEGDEERALAAALREADAALEARGGAAGCSVEGFLEAAELMVPAIDAFFDKVFVMCDDAAVRANRIALLRDVASFPRGVLDLSALPGF